MAETFRARYRQGNAESDGTIAKHDARHSQFEQSPLQSRIALYVWQIWALRKVTMTASEARRRNRKSREPEVSGDRDLPSYFLSVDWSKCAGKRSVYLSDVRRRRIERYDPPDAGWNLEALLDLADGLSRDGSVLIGMDVVLGVPKGYWRSVLDDRRRGAPKDFVDWLSSRGQFAGFFETVADPADWGVNRPWFEVRKGAGGLTAFTNKVRGGMRRRIDAATGGNPVFAVSGMPGTVGSGTRDFWRELSPHLSLDRRFKIWPFEGEFDALLEDRGVALCEIYPALAYAAALADDLPTGRIKVAKGDVRCRKHACNRLGRADWVHRHRVDLGSFHAAKANDDDFDAHFTAAAVLRCMLEGAALVDIAWTDATVEGSMLLAGPVEPDRKNGGSQSPLRRMAGRTARWGSSASSAISRSQRGNDHRCPIPGCRKIFRESRRGWDGHVGSPRMHPEWHPEVLRAKERRRLFRAEFGDWFE